MSHGDVEHISAAVCLSLSARGPSNYYTNSFGPARAYSLPVLRNVILYIYYTFDSRLTDDTHTPSAHVEICILLYSGPRRRVPRAVLLLLYCCSIKR